MKKIITSLLIAAMLLSFAACGEKEAYKKSDETTEIFAENENKETADINDTEEAEENPEESETEESAETEEPTETFYWTVGRYTDEFGDYTGNYFLNGLFANGNYSNDYKSYGNLLTRIIYDPEGNYFEVNLFEDGSTKAYHPENGNMKFLYKIGDKKYETSSLFSLDTTGSLVIDYKGNNSVGDNLTNALRNGEDVTCIIYIYSAKYNFTLDASGFAEAEAELNSLSA